MSRVNPLVYILIYLSLIPIFGALFTALQPHGFYAPYAKYEPDAVADTEHLASTLKAAIQRSFDARKGQQFIVDDWQLDLSSLVVDHVRSVDGTQLSFRVRFTADGIGDRQGARQFGWAVVATVPENPIAATMGASGVTVYRFPQADVSGFASPFKEQSQKLFELLFDQADQGFNLYAPALALNYNEDLQFRRFLAGIRGDPSEISGFFWRMLYLSAVVITTLGLGDIIPITWQARAMVGTEAVTGIVLAGLFLNALAHRASGAR